LAAEYKIRGVPTLILIRDGKEVARTSGTKTADQLKQFAAG
jgi:thioredoxin 1